VLELRIADKRERVDPPWAGCAELMHTSVDNADMAGVCQAGRLSPDLTVVSPFVSPFFLDSSFVSGPVSRRHRVLATVDAADIRGLGTAQTVVRRGAVLALDTDIAPKRCP